MIVVGAGTGGTVTGIARKLKEKIPSIQVRSRHTFTALARPREQHVMKIIISS